MEENTIAVAGSSLSVKYIPTATSTNTQLMQQDFADRSVIYTFNQTAGRGRLDRQWINFPDKSLALSVGLRSVKCPPIWVTAALSVAAVATLGKNGLSGAWIKWPNDIFVGQSKLAGVLTESTWKNNAIDKCVTGIGINLNSSEEELQTAVKNRQITSFFAQTGRKINPKHFTNCFLENIVDCLNLLEKDKISQLKQIWLSETKLIGQKAELSEIYKGSPIVRGVIENIDDDGFLYFNDGEKVFQVITGDIKIIF